MKIKQKCRKSWSFLPLVLSTTFLMIGIHGLNGSCRTGYDGEEETRNDRDCPQCGVESDTWADGKCDNSQYDCYVTCVVSIVEKENKFYVKRPVVVNGVCSYCQTSQTFNYPVNIASPRNTGTCTDQTGCE